MLSFFLGVLAGFVSLDIQTSPSKGVINVCFGGPIAFSAGVWMSRA